MLINGINITTFGARLYDRVLNSNKVDTVQDWLDGDIQPTNIRQQDKFRKIKLSFLILGTDESGAFFNISKLTQALKTATIQFDDLDLLFKVTLIGAANTKRLKNGNFIVSYNLTSDYAIGAREVYTSNANLTNSFKLNLLYYKDGNTLITSDTVNIRASKFTGENDTFDKIGIDINKYKPEYYNNGIVTNLNNLELTYETLQYLDTLIVNYNPISYTLSVSYSMDYGDEIYVPLRDETVQFTAPQLASLSTIGQLINPQQYKPEGYKSSIQFDRPLTVENVLAASPVHVFFTKVTQPTTRNVVLRYYQENDNETYDLMEVNTINVSETQIDDGTVLRDLVNINAFKPEGIYYNNGYIRDHSDTEVVTIESIQPLYEICYSRVTHHVIVEYYLGTYPDWYRLTTNTISTKYKTTYENNFELADISIDVNKYVSSEFQSGRIYGGDTIDSYEELLQIGIVQVYYVPIDYPIIVNYQFEGEETQQKTITINALDFLNDPALTDIISLNDPSLDTEGFVFSAAESYDGPVTLQGLTQASPITIQFNVVAEERYYNIELIYRKQLASSTSTIVRTFVTVSESQCTNGLRYRDIINTTYQQPEYYEAGIIEGHSASALVDFDSLESRYYILYLPTDYTLPVRYYRVNDANNPILDDANWLGSSQITYNINSFEVNTTLYSLGLDLNMYKPSYCGDGYIENVPTVSFSALQNTDYISVLYEVVGDAGDNDDEIDYPHRFLFLQHNDLGDFEAQHPEWTLNHAYINTGVTAADMSKLTVVMECGLVDENVPLHEVNGAYGYLFGSSSGNGQFYMRFNNQTKYHAGDLTGVNLYEAKAGYYTNMLSLTEANAIGWSENSGIYSSARDGYSYATFTYTNALQSENAPMIYPLYLFANNNAGTYANGLAGIGIYGCRIYYDNVLIRDMIPVMYYDKIGDLVAPSNCLYDKVTKTFFEDGTHQNSFNIIDDERYEDNNPDHHIGFCYVNYYQNDSLVRTIQYYFRESDFLNGKVYNPYTEWQVDYFQPSYYEPGVILEYQSQSTINATFESLNNQVFNVKYIEGNNQIVINYYQEDALGERTLIETEIKSIKESDFYQVPSFGDIVRLNKYKPEGYKTDYVFPEPKVSLARVMAHTPYDIVYTEETNPLETYTTTIRYIKKVYGIRTYETIGEITLTFDQTDFRDGEYIDYYIDYNAMKPEAYYGDGEPYEWYNYDLRLDTPENLQEVYIIKYDTTTQYIDVNYYTDEWDEANLIASTTWSFKLDDFDPQYPFYIADHLPNTYINKYRPSICDGGVLQNSNQQLSFYDLVQLEEIAIIYETIEEPNDPMSAIYEKKCLYWGDMCNKIFPSYEDIIGGISHGYVPEPYQVPYIDLGYKPKELGRLRVEITAAVKPVGCHAPLNPFSAFSDEYTGFFGYAGPPLFEVKYLTRDNQVVFTGSLIANPYAEPSTISPGSKGYFRIKPRLPVASGLVYTTPGPQTIDHQTYMKATTNNQEWGMPNDVFYSHTGQIFGFRRGYQFDTDENYEKINVFNNYSNSIGIDYSRWNTDAQTRDEETGEYGYTGIQTDGFIQVNSYRLTSKDIYSYDDLANITAQDGDWVAHYEALGNPYSIVMDAYNNYMSAWDITNSNTPFTWQLTNTDNPIWEDIERPRGSLALFATTNPTTGEINRLPAKYWSYLTVGAMNGAYSTHFGDQVNTWNPYSTELKSLELEVYYKASTGSIGKTNSEGDSSSTESQAEGASTQNHIVKKTINVQFTGWKFPTFPWLNGGCVWGVKIYDQDKLVRDLIPVAKDDVIFDYVMPEDGLFDLVTEIFFGNSNPGEIKNVDGTTKTYTRWEFHTVLDILSYGHITTNYYDYDNSYIGHQWVDIPTWFYDQNTSIEDILCWNDMKPDNYHLDGWLDIDEDVMIPGTNKKGHMEKVGDHHYKWVVEDDNGDYDVKFSLAGIYELGTANIYYRLRQYTKTVVYYKGNTRVGSKDLFYSLEEIQNANSLSDLGINADLYYDENFHHGEVYFNESIIAEDDIEAFINAPSPIVVYRPFTVEERPDLLYVEYYRGGAYGESLISADPNDANYLNCNLSGRVINPNGAIKYLNHYHTALYADEDFGEFMPYQVHVKNRYVGLHAGPGRMYNTLAMIVEQDNYTIIQERNGWGRLKEYPSAWIMLNQTEPISGPGTNPAYDVNAEQVATIDFGETVTITKLTIDRLWCYVPAVESWVKAHDISLDQTGGLYNALKIEVHNVVDLIDSSTNEWADIGIDVHKWPLFYHTAPIVYVGGTVNDKWSLHAEANNTEYSGGNFTEANLQDIHDIQIVYPERIYNYTCIYYKDNKAVANELGRATFSCSVSDWNPDWETFIETSWNEEEQYGEATVRSTGSASTHFIYANTDTSSTVVHRIPNGSDLYITGDSVEVGATNWVPVHWAYWYNDPTLPGTNNTWREGDGWIQENQIIINKPYGGFEAQVPKLYKDTVLTLTWDYFGLERNKFKPNGYSDGIYMWNPRSWDLNDVKFSFEELITCGTQYVFYPSFDPDIYKLVVYKQPLGKYHHYSDGTDLYLINEGIRLDLTDSDKTYRKTQISGAGTTWYRENFPYTIHASGEWHDDLYNKLQPSTRTNTQLTGQFTTHSTVNDAYGSNIKPPFQPTYFNSIRWPWIKTGVAVQTDYSYYRDGASSVVSVGNSYTGTPFTHYVFDFWQLESEANDELFEIEPSTNLKKYRYPALDNQYIGRNTITNERELQDYEEIATNTTVAITELQDGTLLFAGQDISDALVYGVIYNVASFYQNMMCHYYVPVPKGMWYRFNDQEMQMPDNGLYDLITNTFARSFRTGDTYDSQTYNYGTLLDNNDEIYYRNATIRPQNIIDVISNASYETESCNYVVQITDTTKAYTAPNMFATEVGTLTTDLIVPVSEVTTPQEHVVGTWYKSGDMWFEATNTQIYTGEFDTTKLQYGKITTALLPTTRYSNFYVYQNPKTARAGAQSSYQYSKAVGILTGYYVYNYQYQQESFIFDGLHWIPKEYTSEYRAWHDKWYAITTQIPVYSLPIDDDSLIVDTKYAGDRVFVIDLAGNDRDWGYIETGWIRLGGNTSLIEE